MNKNDLQKSLMFKDWFDRELKKELYGTGSKWANNPDAAWKYFCKEYDNDSLGVGLRRSKAGRLYDEKHVYNNRKGWRK